ncbi:hypothetical protein Tco_1413157 [Tanacetum coccineum]
MFATTTPENTPMAYRASTSANPNPMRNNDLQTELEYFIKDYDEEREMEPRPEPTRAATPPLRNTEVGRPLEEAPRVNGGQSVNLPPLLAAHLERGENGKPLQSSLTFAYGGQALPNNIGGNLPSNAFKLPHANSTGKPPYRGNSCPYPTGRERTTDLRK